MHKLTYLLLGICLISSAHAEQTIPHKALENALAQEAKQKINVFAAELKSELVTAIQTEGLQSAVKVCHERAPEIAESLSTDGWTVARTSLKTRNAKNLPDDWESQAMVRFDEQYEAGEKANTLSTKKMNNNQFRFMKAIPTGQVCLACHGSSVDPALLKSINRLYPKDAAVGFTLEDIRGAFTLTKKLPAE